MATIAKAIMIFVIMVVIVRSAAATARALPSPEDQAHTAYDNGNYSKVISIFKQAFTKNSTLAKDPRILTDLASAEAEVSNLTGALSLYKGVLSIDPHHIGALLGIGETLKRFAKLGNNLTAVNFFKEAIAQQPKDDVKFLQIQELEKASAFIELGNFSQAIDIVNKILNHDPTNTYALEVKALALLYIKKAIAALDIFNTLISQGNHSPWILDNRGVSLLQLGRYIGALANFNDAIKADSTTDSYAYYNRAVTLLNLDFISQKIYSLEQLKQHKQQLTLPHLNAALQDLSRVLTINPHNTDARVLKNLLIEGIQRGYIIK
ncbi:MAG: tetratricopeptide repeat protein [Candidatus Nitrosopolaris sp.]